MQYLCGVLLLVCCAACIAAELCSGASKSQHSAVPLGLKNHKYFSAFRSFSHSKHGFPTLHHFNGCLPPLEEVCMAATGTWTSIGYQSCISLVAVSIRCLSVAGQALYEGLVDTTVSPYLRTHTHTPLSTLKPLPPPPLYSLTLHLSLSLTWLLAAASKEADSEARDKCYYSCSEVLRGGDKVNCGQRDFV